MVPLVRAENNMSSVAKEDCIDDTSARKLTTEMVLLLENPSKGNNLGSILRCAVACGVSQVHAVGYDKCATQGSHGADKNVNLVAFATAAQAVQCDDNKSNSILVIGLLGAFPNGYREHGYPVVYHQNDNDKNLAVPLLESPSLLEGDKSCTVLGTSYPIHTLSSDIINNNDNPIASIRSARTIFLAISKDRLGLPIALAQQCHLFCHVPCIALWGDNEGQCPLLDCPSTLSITLHHLAQQVAGYHDEATFYGHKFHVVRPDTKSTTTTTAAQQQAQLQRQQHREETLREAAAMQAENSAALRASLWDDDADKNHGDY